MADRMDGLQGLLRRAGIVARLSLYRQWRSYRGSG